MDTITRVGIIGGGQLAAMMAEAAPHLGLQVEFLARRADDPISRISERVLVGDARNGDDLRRLAARTDVLTFDHELVEPAVLAEMEEEGIEIRPGSRALSVAIDKQQQSELFTVLGMDQPRTIVVRSIESALEAISEFGGRAVLKVATGGYDGRGVLLDVSEQSVRSWFPDGPTTVLVQKCMDVDHEFAVQVVRAIDGTTVTYEPVRTVQREGMCSHVSFPLDLGEAIEAEALRCARAIADAIGVIGILTVEFFVVDGALLVNELAARPHNSGHLTIEACRTSQFENHLRGVAGLPLGPTDRVVPAAAMVNLVGEIRSDRLASSILDDANVHVHLYGKEPRPGRKVGHVTAVAESESEAVAIASRIANELQTGKVAS